MASTTAVHACIDNELKENAENILGQPGISLSSTTQMLYGQMALRRGFPLNPQLPLAKLTAIGGMSQVEFDIELTKGIESLKSGKLYIADDVDAELAKEFGL